MIDTVDPPVDARIPVLQPVLGPVQMPITGSALALMVPAAVIAANAAAARAVFMLNMSISFQSVRTGANPSMARTLSLGN